MYMQKKKRCNVKKQGWRSFLSMILVMIMIVTMVPAVPVIEVEAATKTINAEDIVNIAKSWLGQRRHVKENAYSHCLGFTNVVYRAAGGDSSANGGTPNGIIKSGKLSKSEIPVGAIVFFYKKGDYGHAAIYIGNNQVISEEQYYINGKMWGGIVKQRTMDYWSNSAEYSGWWFANNNVVQGGVNLPSNIYISGETCPTGNLSPGKSFGIYGKIYSNYNLTNVTATVTNSSGTKVLEKSVNPNATSYDLHGAVNNALIFNNLGAGNYRYVVTATDSKGYFKELVSSNFIVGTVCTPNIYTNAVVGGVKVSMSADNGTIYYTTDGTTPTTGSARYNGAFVLSNSATVKAIAVNNGATGDVRSSHTSRCECCDSNDFSRFRCYYLLHNRWYRTNNF